MYAFVSTTVPTIPGALSPAVCTAFASGGAPQWRFAPLRRNTNGGGGSCRSDSRAVRALRMSSSSPPPQPPDPNKIIEENNPLKEYNVNPQGSGTFGFSRFAEIWNGRWAMLGFVAALLVELKTGRGIFEQLGIEQPMVKGVIVMALFAFTIVSMLGYYTVKRAALRDAEIGRDNRKEGLEEFR